MNKSLPKLIAIVGPTASGKTDCAIEVAKAIGGEIISADSRTIYKQMDIGTAKPKGDRRTASEVRREDIEGMGIHGTLPSVSITDLFEEKPLMIEDVPHWGIDIITPDQSYSAADFKEYAEKKIEQILERGNVPILAGGTGLYIQAVVDNLQFNAPAPNEALRKELDALTHEELLARLRLVDASAEGIVDVENRRRLMRAIEVVELSGKPFAEQQVKGEQKYEALMLGMSIEREQLYERIDERVDIMVAQGLVDEVRALKNEYSSEAPGMNAIGYRQICQFLDGYIKLKDAIDLVKRDSRHYAKRQLTWFKRIESIQWISTRSEAVAEAKNFLNK